jgi:hypothetical protein
MTAQRKSRRARRSAPPPPAPTDNQLFEAMLAFATLKMRYRLEVLPHAPPIHRYIVRVLPEMVVSEEAFDAAPRTPSPPAFRVDALEIHRFPSEAAARRWREHEIIRETVKVAMRTKP